MYDWFMDTGIRIVAIIVVALILYLVLKLLIPKLMRRHISKRMADESETAINQRIDTLSSIMDTIVGIVILILALLTILPEFGVNIATLLAGVGVIGLALAFAAQGLVKDFIGGFFVLFEDQYRIGDVVGIAGIVGVIEEITLRRSIMRDIDAKVHSIPNGHVDISTNYTRNYSRVNLDISVGYGEVLGKVIETIDRVCQEMAEDPKWKDDFVSTPAVLRVNNLGDSGVEIKILGDTKPASQWAIMGELRLRIKNTFDSEGIEIPWPHTKVYFGNSPNTSNQN
ncbi:MAG: mechanosensitive ion channel family protein [Dehalococcoidia bacterium]